MKPIVLDQVSFKRNDDFIFRHLDYEFNQGTFTLLRGDSGSGKSTLLKLIAGFSELNFDGKIFVFAEEQSSRSILEKAKMIGMVFQNPNQQFTMKTLRQEIIFALENFHYSYTDIQLKMEEVTEITNTRYLLDQELVSLSGGEKQRASLAVLLAIDAPILLLDEPFASVDSSSRKQLIKLLGKLRDIGKTIILCDHDLSDYQGIADQVITLNQLGLKTDSLSLLSETEKPILSKQEFHCREIITFKQVAFNQGDKQLLRPTDCWFQEGVTTLTGDNGVGKSTLLKTMVQQRKYTGKMYLGQKRLRKNKGLYQKMTLVVQDAIKQFVCLTPREELTFNAQLSEKEKKKQFDILNELGLLNKLDGSLFHLSEGQKKMIQLTTMLSLNQEILLLDEPFTGLDDKACQLFMDWMLEKEQHQIIVSHRLAPLSGNSDHHVELCHKKLNLTGKYQIEKESGYDYCQNQFA